MICLVYLATERFGPLAKLLKASSFEIHVATDLDDILDQLWFHGSDVACIVLQGLDIEGFDVFSDAMTDWPTLPVLLYDPKGPRADRRIANLRCSETYSLASVAHALPPRDTALVEASR